MLARRRSWRQECLVERDGAVTKLHKKVSIPTLIWSTGWCKKIPPYWYFPSFSFPPNFGQSSHSPSAAEETQNLTGKFLHGPVWANQWDLVLFMSNLVCRQNLCRVSTFTDSKAVAVGFRFGGPKKQCRTARHVDLKRGTLLQWAGGGGPKEE